MAARLFGLAVLAGLVAGCDLHPGPDSTQRYRQWLKSGHEQQAAAYTAHLRDEGVDAVLPLPDLLRSGRRWRKCQAEEFSLPPRAQWRAMTPTLKLVAELRAAGVLKDARVASAWRHRDLNDCEGGSSRSRHLENNALDFDVVAGADVTALCEFWRRRGAAHRFGLGFYSPTAIHVDTSGFRTWGHDHHRGTSLCERDVPAR